jgi:hypothetical protein
MNAAPDMSMHGGRSGPFGGALMQQTFHAYEYGANVPNLEWWGLG